MGLIQDLYAAHNDNRTFLHTRFGLGGDLLKPYKEKLERWLWPDVSRNQDISVAKAKQAISSYRKAVGHGSSKHVWHTRHFQICIQLILNDLLRYGGQGRD